MSKNEKNGENVAVNGNLEQFQKSEKTERKAPKGEKKARIFSIVTYATEQQIAQIIGVHRSSIRAYAYIVHDEDEAEPHTHLIVRTYSSWTVGQILRWFDRLRRIEGTNTFGEIANDTLALREYLTHSDDRSIEEGKVQYPKSRIRDYGLWDIVDQRDSYDETYAMINDALGGMGTKALVRRYGKNYLYHITAVNTAVEMIEQQERYDRFHIQFQARKERGMLTEVSTDDIRDIDEILQ